MLHIQDPFFSNSYTLHEALIKSCSDSIEGFGAYAFASKSGIEILLKDNDFNNFLDNGTYTLIVGIDEITNVASLNALKQIVEEKPTLEVKVFYHTNKGSLFHPKISFFKNVQGGGSLIIGSNNLTLGGLRKNREAFYASDLSEEEFIEIYEHWNLWLEESNDYLKSLDDEIVINRAKENQYVTRTKKIPIESIIENEPELISIAEVERIEDGWVFYEENDVLLAEIPRSGDRWKQANFDIDTFKNFFGATPGDNNQRILFRHINDDSNLSEIENRPSVSVISQNYRFELDAASGLAYPADGKPIGIFIKLTTRMFLYHLFMPDNPVYDEIKNWLDENWTGRTDRMKRIVTKVSLISEIIDQTVFKGFLVQIQ